MNKSKFLKKSLAAVLAVLMIVAMIPLSASAAASAPKVYLQNQQINFGDGNEQSVTVTAETGLPLRWDSQTGATLKFVNKDDTRTDVGNATSINLADFPVENGVYTIKLELYGTADEGGEQLEGTYTLKVTVKPADINLDATIKDVTGIDKMVSAKIDDDANTITITMPYDAAMPSVLTSAISSPETVFVPTKSDATVAFDHTATQKTVTVTMTNATKVYTVKVVNQVAVTSFKVPNQIGEAEFKDKITKAGDPTIDIKVEKSASLDKVIPTFTVDSNLVEKVTTYKGATATGASGSNDEDDEIPVTSGVTELAFTSTQARIFNVYLKGVAAPQVLKVTLTRASDASEAELTSVKVVNSATGKTLGSSKVTGENVTIPMGVNTDYTINTANIVVEASANAKVTVPSQNITASGDPLTLTAVAISGKKFTIRVESEDGKTTKDYNITLVPATQVETNLTDFTIKDSDGELYIATFSGLTGTINMPFKYKGKLDTSHKLYATTSAGSTAYIGSSFNTAVVNGTTNATALGSPIGAPIDDGFIENYNVKVVADDHAAGADDSARTYTIKVVFARPKTGNLINAAAAVGTNDLSAVTADNTYKTEIGKVKTSGGSEVDAVKITLPHTVVTANKLDAATGSGTTKVYFKDLKLSPEATLYAFAKTAAANATDKVNTGTALKPLDPAVLGTQTNSAKFITVTKDAYTAYDSTAGLDTDKAITFYVINEEGFATITPVSSAISDLETLCGTNKAKKYYVYFVKADPEKGCNLTNIKSVVDPKVRVDFAGGKITITVPNSYAFAHDTTYSDANPDHKKCSFSLNFTTSKLASMTDSETTPGPNALTSDNGKDKETGTPTRFYVKYDDATKATYKLFTSAGKEVKGNWVVTSEDTANSKKYPVDVKVADAEKGAEILTLKCGNASASKNGAVLTLNMPFGASLNPVKLDITASKMATVKINNAAYDANKGYSLLSDLTITVTSEDTKTTNVYTLKTKVGDRFSDVKSTDWFDEYVQKAADAKIIEGMGDGTFKPYNNITRQDFALMTVRMLGKTAEADAMKDNVPFKDEAKIADYAKGAVAYCYTNKIINGRETGNFDPTANITREEAAKILSVALGLDVTGTSTTFADNSRIQKWAVGYVSACQNADIFGGDEANRFNPQAKITRAETAKVMVKSLEIK